MSDVGSGAGEIGDRHLAHADRQVFYAATVAAHVERIEIVDVDLLATVVPLASPDLGVRLALEQIAAANEGFS